MALSISKFIAKARDLGFEDRLGADDDKRTIGLAKDLPHDARTLLIRIEKCNEAVFNTDAQVKQPIVLNPTHPMHALWLNSQHNGRGISEGRISTVIRWGNDRLTDGGGVEGLLRELGFATEGAIWQILHRPSTRLENSKYHPETAKKHGINGIELINTQGQTICVSIVVNLALSTRKELQEAGLEAILAALPAVEEEARSMPTLQLCPPVCRGA